MTDPELATIRQEEIEHLARVLSLYTGFSIASLRELIQTELGE